MLTINSFTFNPFQENTYLLSAENGDTIIIDPGMYFDEEKKLFENFIANRHLKPVQLINTHAHLDHVFGAKWVAEKYGLELFLHENDLPTLQIATASGAKYGMPFDNYNGKIHPLKDGDTVTLGKDTLKVLFVPGHAPGHVAFYNQTQGFVINGDVLFKDGVGRTDLPGSNAQDLVKSIKEKLYTLPDETVVYVGHGPSTTIGYEKKNNPFVKG